MDCYVVISKDFNIYTSDDDRVMYCIGVFSTLEKAKEIIMQHNKKFCDVDTRNPLNYYVYKCNLDEIMNLEDHETCFTYNC